MNKERLTRSRTERNEHKSESTIEQLSGDQKLRLTGCVENPPLSQEAVVMRELREKVTT